MLCSDVVECFLFFNQGLEEKPKQGRSRSKSKDTPMQPSSLGQQNPGMDWQPPKGKQTKPRQRKSKKTEAKVDPDLELQQQMLQQQLYQQMEQRHRLIQQKQGIFVEQGQQPGQQHNIPLNQHLIDNPGLLAQQPVDMPHPMRPLSHTPELPQGPPSRPDSQISLPPGTPGPQMPLPPSTQIPPGYPQTAEQSSFAQRFPTPEHYLQQFGQHPMHQRQPTVQYIAEANNPFSDEFQGLQNKGRGRAGAKKKPGSRKPGKPRGKKVEEAAAASAASGVDHLQQQQQQQQQVNPASQEPSSPWPVPTPSPLAQGIKQEQPEAEGIVPESAQVQINTGNSDPYESVTHENPEGSKGNSDVLVQEMASEKDISSEQCTKAGSSVASNEKDSCNASLSEEPKNDVNVAEKESGTPAPAEDDSNESAEKKKGPCNGTGLEALQKLESMVADMASEEEACKELEKQSEFERIHLQLEEDEYDPEMDKMYEGDFMEDAPFERTLLSPCKAVGNGSQANSVASLECHEESLISPLLEEPERRKERQKFFAEASCNDTVEKKATDIPRREGEQGGKEETSGKPSTATDPTPTPAACNAVTPNAAAVVDHMINSGKAEANETKHFEDSIKDTVTGSTQDPGQEISSEETITMQSSERQASPQDCANELQQCHETREPEPFFSQTSESTASKLIHPEDQPPESSIPAPITPNARPAVREVLNNSNGDAPLAQEVGDHQQTCHVGPCGVSAPRDGCQAFPQQRVADGASYIVSEAVPETVNRIPESLSHHQNGHVQEPIPTTSARPIQRDKPAKTPKQPSRSKNQHSLAEAAAKKKAFPKEEDPIKKQLQELRRQEYERKKREYEEQQKKKRALQMKLRIEKQLIREQRKRQRIYMNTNNRSKQKAEVKNSAPPSLKISTPNNTHKDIKPAAPLSLCEPKLLLTHALSHPYGSRPFNGQCLLKGNFGSAKVDGVVDYYSQFTTSDMDIVVGHPPTPPSSLPPSPGVHQHKNDSAAKCLVNGDVSPDSVNVLNSLL